MENKIKQYEKDIRNISIHFIKKYSLPFDLLEDIVSESKIIMLEALKTYNGTAPEHFWVTYNVRVRLPLIINKKYLNLFDYMSYIESLKLDDYLTQVKILSIDKILEPFNELELAILYMYFVESNSVHKIHKELDISIKRVNNIIRHIKTTLTPFKEV